MASHDTDDSFEYNEIPIEEALPDLPPDDEDDVQALVRAIQERGPASSGSPQKQSIGSRGGFTVDRDFHGGGVQSKENSSVTSLPGSADDFIRNFLIRSRMYRSLDAFNTEFYELKARRALPGEDLLRVPDAYSANAKLEEDISRLRMELASAQELSAKAQGTWERFRKERDFHRMHHRRVVQEKNKLIVDLRRLKAHYDKYEPTLAELRTKYELAMKEKANARMERDRVAARCLSLEASLRSGAAMDSSSISQQQQQQQGSPVTGRSSLVGGSGAAAVAGLSRRPAAGAAAPTALSSARALPVPSRSGAPPHHSHGSTTAASTTSSPFQLKSEKDAVLPLDADVVNPYLDLVFEPAHADSYRLTGTVRAHSAAVSSLAFHPTKAVFATTSDDMSWRLWGVSGAGGAELIMNGEGHRTWLSGCDFHPGGTLLATCGGEGTVKLWSLTSAACTATLSDHVQPVWGVSWHYSGDFLVSAGMDHSAKLWDVTRGRVRQSFRGHVDSVNAAVFQPFSSLLATASGDKTVSVWDSRSGLCIQSFYGHTNAVKDVVWNLRGDTLASCDGDGSVRVWDVRMVVERASASVGRQCIQGLCMDRSGVVIATACDDGVIRVFDAGGSGVGGLGLLSSLRGHEDSAQAVAFDPSAQYLLSASRDATVRIWSEGVVKGLELE